MVRNTNYAESFNYKVSKYITGLGGKNQELGMRYERK